MDKPESNAGEGTGGSIEKPPAWVRDYLEGLDYEAKRRDDSELEAQIPGLHEAFEVLIDRLPGPYSDQLTATEFPVVAAVARIGQSGKLEIVSISTNQVNKHGDSTAHAEIEALREAQKLAGTKHLKDHFLLSTFEPCVMCSGAIVNTELSGLIYGARHADLATEHALVNGQYKPYRTSPLGFDAGTYFASYPGIRVVDGFMEKEVLERMRRLVGSWDRYYRDPDAH